MERPRECPICNLFADRYSNGEIVEVDCRRCGVYLIASFLLRLFTKHEFSEEDRKLLPYLSAYTRQYSNLPKKQKSVLTTDNWRELARLHSSTPPLQKAEMLLDVLHDRTRYPGNPASFDPLLDYPLINAASDGEFHYFVDYLEEIGYVKRYGTDSLIITIKGWEHLQPVKGGEPGRCFVAISFDESMKEVYESIQRSIEQDCGFKAIRVDHIQYNDDITDKIIAEIRRAQFTVAEFTGQKRGVYFEAGFAMALGRKVVWICKKDEICKLHFDTNHFNYIGWATPEELRQLLTDRIRATIEGAKLS